MIRQFLIIAAVLGFVGVALGAFGAHALSATLEAHDRVDTFQTGSDYHLIHTLALIAAAWLLSQPDRAAQRWARRAGYFFMAGILFFSGSLYILAIFDLSFMGAVAPIGGTAFLIGWVCLGMAGAAAFE